MKILVLPGDGIGPEIVDGALSVLQAVDRRFDLSIDLKFEEIGFRSLERFGTTLQPSVMESARSFDGLILGTQSHADYPPPESGGVNVSAAFRVGLDLYANIRPARTRHYLPSNMRPGKTMDLVIVREATEGFYPDRNMAKGWGECMPDPDIALSIRKISRQGSMRIARKAFALAQTRRKRLTVVHKANSFHMTDGLFLESVQTVAKEYPDVQLTSVLIDASTALLVRSPEQFDVILTTNLYGDILSDLASELSGSLGLAGSIMVNDHQCCAQAQHGSAPDIQGLDQANPVSMILSVAMLLEWLGVKHVNQTYVKASKVMQCATDLVLLDSSKRTVDLGGRMGCKGFAEAVSSVIKDIH